MRRYSFLSVLAQRDQRLARVVCNSIYTTQAVRAVEDAAQQAVARERRAIGAVQELQERMRQAVQLRPDRKLAEAVAAEVPAAKTAMDATEAQVGILAVQSIASAGEAMAEWSSVSVCLWWHALSLCAGVRLFVLLRVNGKSRPRCTRC
jgi:hypothetical protein